MTSIYSGNVDISLGRVVKVYYDDWKIDFKPIESKDNNSILSAYPLVNHTHELYEDNGTDLDGSSVIIINPNDHLTDTLFYIPITIREYVGLKNGPNKIDITKAGRGEVDSLMDVAADNLDITVKSKTNIKSDEINVESVSTNVNSDTIDIKSTNSFESTSTKLITASNSITIESYSRIELRVGMNSLIIDSEGIHLRGLKDFIGDSILHSYNFCPPQVH